MCDNTFPQYISTKAAKRLDNTRDKFMKDIEGYLNNLISQYCQNLIDYVTIIYAITYIILIAK